MPRHRSAAFIRWVAHCSTRLRTSRRAERRRRLQRALDQLSPRRRTIFLLHRIDKLACGDIAARLATSREDVEAEIAAALVALASSLDD